MAQQIDNNYNTERHIADFLGRSNPWALITNAMKLKGLERGDACNDYVPQYDYALSSGAGTLTLTPTAGNLPTNGSLKYYKWVIRDHSLGEVYGALDLANPSTPVVIDVSSLNANDVWDVVFSSGVARTNFPSPCRVAYTINLPGGSLANDASGSLKFLAEIECKVNGAIVAGASIALGALAIGADNRALTVLSNLGVLPNKINKVTISGTGLRPGYLPPATDDPRFPALNDFSEDVLLLQTASGGATVTVDIYENDSLTITKTFDITFTVA